MGIDAGIKVTISFERAAGYLASLSDHLVHFNDDLGETASPSLDLRFADSRSVSIAADPKHYNKSVQVLDVSPQMTRTTKNFGLWIANEPILTATGATGKHQPTRLHSGVEQRRLAFVYVNFSDQAGKLAMYVVGASDSMCAGIVGSEYTRRLLVDSARWFDPTAEAILDIDDEYFDMFGSTMSLPDEFVNHAGYALALEPSGALHRFSSATETT